ncbi:MAG: hypothetical protein JWO83_652 [Caulobacteraceae bacterium]|jgi:DUF1365 family protein|nr:hypothetical protein [Caulobacteraceae bacterium]
MSQFASCLYFGEVVHQRFSPRRHRLRYRVFQGLFDLDELPDLERKLRFFSHNRTNLFAFHDSDHGDGGTLRAYVENLMRQAGLSVEGGRIVVLCMPRVLGFVFNPVSIFYCYDGQAGLVALIYEVNNTFGQRHSYVIAAESRARDGVRQRCEKAFYVSPFMDMDMNYDFRLTLPEATLATTIKGNDPDGAPLIFASFAGVRRELSDMSLLCALVRYPLLTVGVVAAIHWEAVKLFAKGLRLRPRPSPPAVAVTIVQTPRATAEEFARVNPSGLHKMDKQSA